MADLRIVDAPVLLQESITDDVKMPTGGLGNFPLRIVTGKQIGRAHV